jgi:hypothetical protein
MKYHELQTHAFKRFSLATAFRTSLPTLKAHLFGPTLPASEKPALCTLNILPPMMTVWHHLAKKYLGERVDIVIFDSSGKLKRSEFPDATVIPYLNVYAATKNEFFLKRIAKHRMRTWICDDDVFLVNERAVDVLEQDMNDPKTAVVSFLPRPGWKFTIEGNTFDVSSSYCTGINREIFMKEKLSMKPCNGNIHNPDSHGNPRRFDTFDKANEILLEKGYRCRIVSEEERKDLIVPFHGISNAVMLLNYFKTPEQTLEFFTKPEESQWNGNILYRAFAGMLVITGIQELYKEIKGVEYSLPSLPKKEDLLRIQDETEPFLKEGHTFTTITGDVERLRGLL